MTGYALISSVADEEISYLNSTHIDPADAVERSYHFFVSQLEIYLNEGTISEEQQEEVLEILNDISKPLIDAYMDIMDFCDREDEGE